MMASSHFCSDITNNNTIEYKTFIENLVYSSIEVHPTQNAILIKFSLQLSISTNSSESFTPDIINVCKIVHIVGMKTSTDFKILAKYIFRKCSDILDELVAISEIEQILDYLSSRKKSFPKQHIFSDQFNAIADIPYCYDLHDFPRLIYLSDYIGLLYNGMEAKIKGTSLILQLARQPDNLSGLLEHNVLVTALVRVLREEWRKNVMVSTNIIYFFFCLSTLSFFHSIISKYRIGSLCIQLIENELEKLNLFPAQIKGQSSLIVYQHDTNTLNISAISSEGQVQLLRLSLYLLLNISENEKTELKIINKGLINILFIMLEINNKELVILTLSFMKKLSIYHNNIVKYRHMNIVENINEASLNQNNIMTHIILRLYFNLSFDSIFQNHFANDEFVSKLITFARNLEYRSLIFCILYHISIRFECVSTFLHKNSILFFRQCLHENINDCTEPELLSLLINLLKNLEFSNLFLDADILNYIIFRSISLQDSLLLRLARTALEHNFYSNSLTLHLGAFKDVFLNFKNFDMLVEIIPILCIIFDKQPEIAMELFEDEFSLFVLEKISCCFGFDDDLIIEFLSFFCKILKLQNSMVLSYNLIELMGYLLNLFEKKQEDKELVLKILYVLYSVLYTFETNDFTSLHQVTQYLFKMIESRSSLINNYCYNCLDLFIANNCTYTVEILKQKFIMHNIQWFEFVTEKGIVQGEEHLSDDVIMDENTITLVPSPKRQNLTYYLAGDNILFV